MNFKSFWSYLTRDQREKLLSHWLCISESQPTCRTNVSLSQNVTYATDHIEIQCHVRSDISCMTPVFTCDPYLPSVTHTTHHNSSGHVWYKRVIAAADIDDFVVFNCSMTFNLTDSYTVVFPEIPVKPEQPVYKFTWSSSAIHVVNASGKFAAFKVQVNSTVTCARLFKYTAVPNKL